MAKNEQEDESDNVGEANTYAKFSGVAFQMIAVIGIFAFAGYKIDEVMAHRVKWVTAVLSLIGVFIALYIVIRSIKS
ncbi:AtpZ/AtpI family protein [Mucilaginibacter lappiensis]|uniref:F0F1-type ATP synthase assembly protein I n=1 Tax=Mucilaginibacter lappiensis TaxID=354630 RepID=A0A1N7E709_9SPHI|nr:AtpZ/AtpI family protein [Mucilaginibacter lappiensis]MBB6111655.1 F0F1-type ATP synthase assembly protein I [Mucilaginibacter lappiensis]MBB6131061.1 F0F1-type ATP synthase assembly protein I [Mucilaginibacter lappiensis]SIR83819.1 Putative F0F1-ATPase subunit Ca2+/Mg2+ transporter [Mucilaginibacter lappiensis]